MAALLILDDTVYRLRFAPCPLFLILRITLDSLSRTTI
jgi:hypothetical protein